MMERRRKRWSIRTKLLLSFFILVLLCTLALVFTRIKTVQVKGNAWYASDEIAYIIFPDELSRNSFLVWVQSLLGQKKAIPFIEDYSIHFENPFTVELIVYEKSIVASVEYMSSYLYFDKDGIVVESTAKKLDHIPIIRNLEVGDVVLYKKLPVEDETFFQEILNITQILSLKNIQTDYIEYNADKSLYLVIGDIRVEMGSAVNMNEQVSVLADILPELKGLSGELSLNTGAENQEKGTYTFKKK